MNRPLLPAALGALVALASTLPLHSARAEERPVLTISGARLRPLKTAIAPPLLSAGADPANARTLVATLENDLAMSGLFEMLDPRSFLAPPAEGFETEQIQFSQWVDIGAEGLVKLGLMGSSAAELRLYSPINGRLLRSAHLTSASGDPRDLAHRCADEILSYYTGTPGIFRTRIAFAKKVGGVKQIALSDWDGAHTRVLTQGSLNLLPAWTADGNALAYTSYQSGNPDLYLYQLGSNRASPLLARDSTLVAGATFSHDGKWIAFAMSDEDGNSHLWLADRNGRNARPLTRGFGLNTSPSFSPDGRQLAFVSNRAGSPQIYVMGVDGGNPRRLTFQGSYNTTPDWSPAGGQIAFTGRDERGVFDVYTIDVATSKISRVTQDQGSNSEPSFSPDGRMLVFESTRSGATRLVISSVDGKIQKPLDTGAGEAFTPAWGPRGP